MNAKPKPEWPAWSLLARPYRPYTPSHATNLRETFARIRAASVKPIKGQA